MLTILWAIFIYALCMSSPSAFPKAPLFNIPHLDKWVHAFIFGVLTFLMVRGYYRTSNAVSIMINHILCILIITIAYGLFIELVQHFFTTNRKGDVLDLLADTIGSLFGVFLFYLIKKYRKKKLTN